MPLLTGTSLIAIGVKVLISVGLSVLQNLILKALTPKPKRPGARQDTGPLATALQAGGPKRVVFGQVGVRGVRLIANKRVGATHHWVAALADWPITSVEKVYIKGVEVTVDGNGWVTSGPWADGGAQTIQLKYFLGDQADLATLVSLDLIETGSIGINTAIVHAAITVPQTDAFLKLFGGAVPDFIFEVKGSKVYDPTDGAQDRDDTSTWQWAQEAILVQAFHQVNPLGRDRPVDEIDWNQVAAIVPRHRAAITSKKGDTAPRFAANGGWFTKEERHSDVESRIGAAHSGGLIDLAVEAAPGGGELQRFFTSDDTSTAVETITEADIGPDGATGPEDAADIDTRPNSVRVTFFNRRWVWESYTLVYENAAWIAEDGGRIEYLDVDLDTVDSHAQATTLGLIALNRARLGQSFDGQWIPRLLPLQADDMVAAVIPDFGLDGTERLRVFSTGIDASDHPVLAFAQDDAAWHADAGALEPDEIDLVLDAQQGASPPTVPAPTVTPSSGGTALRDIDGVLLPGLRIVVTGTAGELDLAIVSVSFGPDDNTETRTVRFDGAASVVTFFGPFPAGTNIDYDVTVTASGRQAFMTTGSHQVSGDTTPPAAPTNLTGSGGVGTISAMADAPSDSDVDALVFAYVDDAAAAPDMATHGTRKVISATPGANDVTVNWTSVATGDHDVYAAAVDRSGNISTSVGPLDVTVT